MSLVEKALAKMKQAAPPPAGHVHVVGVPVPDTKPGVDISTTRPLEVLTSPNDRPLLMLDPTTLRDKGYLPPVPQERVLTEQYRHIKRPLVARALGRGGAERVPRGTVIMITSALPREGKTFTAINLTRSLALEKDLTVLLIDGDIANPQTTRVLGADGEAGLIDALADEQCDIASLVLPTNVQGLEVLPVGRGTDLAAELLVSQRMHDCIERLQQVAPNRIIVVDSAPLLITNEGKSLLPLAGQVVLVVQADVTPQSAVLEAAELFDPSQHVGVVLNQCDQVSGSGYGYRYGGGYGYGYGNAQGDRASGSRTEESPRTSRRKSE